MAKKKSTEELIEQLARMVKRGFDQVATKQDIKALRQHVEGKFRFVDDALTDLKRGVHEIRSILGPLTRTVVEQEERMQNLERRMDRLERKAGVH